MKKTPASMVKLVKLQTMGFVLINNSKIGTKAILKLIAVVIN